MFKLKVCFYCILANTAVNGCCCLFQVIAKKSLCNDYDNIC